MGLIHGAQDIETGQQPLSTHLFSKTEFIDIQYPDGTTGAQRFQKTQPPRIIKSHLNVEFLEKLLKKTPDLKIVNVIRNPKDTFVSYFNYHRDAPHLGPFTGSWDQFFDFTMKGILNCGDFFDFTRKWYKFNKDREISLVLKYEDMKKDPRGHVIKLAKFMDHNISDKVVEYILQKTSVPVMKGEVNIASKKEDCIYQGVKLVRKGQVGDWVNYFSKEQSDLVDVKCEEFFEPLGLTFEYF